MTAKRRKRRAVELPPAVHRKNVAYGRRYRQNRSRVLGQSRACALRLSGCTGWAVEADHIVEAGRGGPSTLSNLQPSCRSCNQKKKDGVRRAFDEGAGRPAPRFPTEGPCPHKSFDGTAWCVGSLEAGHWSRWWLPPPDGSDGTGAVIV
jgi:5-methylcytosine-specific restriction endonuclease McrA